MLLWHLEILRSKVVDKQKALLFSDLRKRISCFRKLGRLYVHKMQKQPFETILEGVCKKKLHLLKAFFPITKKTYTA